MRPAVALLPVAFLLALAGCVRESGSGSSLLPTRPASASPEATEPSTAPPLRAPTSRPSVTASPSPSAFAEGLVVACNGRPSAEQVIALVRKQPSLLPANASVSAKTGPLCSGTWQYTVLAVGDREPLQVVTRGAPQSLTFVTAGTNVCTVDVRTGAPVALLSVANC
jgi:hypothetical protein